MNLHDHVVNYLGMIAGGKRGSGYVEVTSDDAVGFAFMVHWNPFINSRLVHLLFGEEPFDDAVARSTEWKVALYQYQFPEGMYGLSV
ncbi:MAG: hypothetical protein GY797_15745, partial [Deltaproteobacteria bacterium]|nr:hypothetical protein [Deltaproteobacteria bacterium]